jgi:hypothetical protein
MNFADLHAWNRQALACKTTTRAGQVDLLYLVHPGGRIQLKKMRPASR